MLLRHLSFILAFPLVAISAEAPLLWYKQPAAKWVEALPVGNGRLGAMVFGAVEKERIQLNEDTVWAGERRNRINPEAAAAIPRIRKLLFEGNVVEAEALADKSMLSVTKRQPPYQTLGDLNLTFPAASAENYRRQLDLDKGIVTISYEAGGVTYTRTVFSSAVANVIAIRLTASAPGKISFTAGLSRAIDAESKALTRDTLLLSGEAIARNDRSYGLERKVGAKFAAILRVVAEGGSTQSEGATIAVANANAVTILIAASTDVRGPDPVAAARKTIDQAAQAKYASLQAAHIADHTKYFRRVTLDLGGDPAISALPTDERLKRVIDGGEDNGLVALYFQYGRYLLMGSSRPGSMAANLQGIWNESTDPPWGSKFTININTEMNYWPAETCNLSEMHMPLFDLFDNMRESGARTAKVMYNARGVVAHHNTDLWGDTEPIDGVRSGIWPMGAAWIATHAWEHYDFTRDKEFLANRGYPIMRDAALFLLDSLVDDGKGHLVTGPSISPENRYRTSAGQVGSMTMGPYMDIEIADLLFTRVIAASRILNVDEELRSKFSKALAKLPPLAVGKYGQLQEWQEDYDEVEPGHRHMSHLFALYPGIQIPARGPLANAARKTLERRLANGGGHTGWSRAWIINFYTRLQDREQAYQHLLALFRKSTLTNLFDNHPPFQIDGNFGATAAIAEMLVQSHTGMIEPLPTLPAAWPKGSVSGLKLRGGQSIDIAWSNSAVDQITIRNVGEERPRLQVPAGRKVKDFRCENQVCVVNFEAAASH